MPEVFVPGRLCLFGEHSDWAAGYRARDPAIAPGRCLVAGTEQGLRGSFEARPGGLEISSEPAGEDAIARGWLPLEDLAAAARAGGFFGYAAGALASLRERYGVGGLRLHIRSDLPARRGLASSAAICVLVVRAASRAYDLGLSTEQEMDVAYAGERRTGSECGRMDQICAFGRGPVSMQIDGDRVSFEPVPVTRPVHLLIVDLCRGKDTRRILSDLNACYPDAPGSVAAGVREALGERNREIVARAEDRLRAGDGPGLGALMREAQRLFDARVAPACPELAAPHLHRLLAHPALGELAWGAKGVGSQGDGCAQITARGSGQRDALAARLAADLDVRCLPLTLAPEGWDQEQRGRRPLARACS